MDDGRWTVVSASVEGLGTKTKLPRRQGRRGCQGERGMRFEPPIGAGGMDDREAGVTKKCSTRLWMDKSLGEKRTVVGRGWRAVPWAIGGHGLGRIKARLRVWAGRGGR